MIGRCSLEHEKITSAFIDVISVTTEPYRIKRGVNELDRRVKIGV